MEILKIKYHDDKSERAVCAKKADCIDLQISKTINLKAGEIAIILPLGVSIELPEEYEALLCPRSRISKRWGIIQTNFTGTTDGTFCGDKSILGMPVYASEDTTLQFDDCIVQVRITEHQPNLKVVKVDDLGTNNRGVFVSTGKA